MGRIGQILAGWGTKRRIAAGAAVVVLVGLGIGLPLALGSSGSGHPAASGNNVGVGTGGSQPLGGSAAGELNPRGSSTTVPAKAKAKVKAADAVKTKPGSTTPTTAKKVGSAGGAQSSPSTTVSGTSTSAGPTWAQQGLPAGTGGLQTVDCVNGQDCWAGGYSGVVATTDGGAKWAAESFPALAAGDHVAGISCVSTSSCWAVTSAGHVDHTTDGGAAWAAQTVPAFERGATAFAIACAGTARCWIAADGSAWEVAYTTDGGATWSTNPVCAPGYCSDLYSISCPTTTNCMVGGFYNPSGVTSSQAPVSAVWTTSDGGLSWQMPYDFASQHNPTSPVNGLSCYDPNHCAMASQYWLASTSDGGSTWQVGAAPSGYYEGVSCTSVGTCWALAEGGTVLAQATPGGAWTAQYQEPSGNLAAIDCLASGQCWAVQGAVSDFGVADPPPGAVYARAS